MIKNIIFDIGGVLLDLDVNKSYDQLASLLGSNQETVDKMQHILDEYEVGAFSEGSFLHRLQRLSPETISERQLVDAWTAMLGPFHEKRFNMLESLKSQYQLYLLSNTNHTHLQYFHRYLKMAHSVNNIEERYFVKAYYSHLVELSKPDPKIYQYVIDDAKINPAESIFIDDTLKNVVSAKEVGLKAVHHNPSNEISEVIKDYITGFNNT